MAPPEVLSLLSAWEQATSRSATLDYMRLGALGVLVQRGFTADDVRLVIRYLNAMIKRGEERGKVTFTRSSLEFDRLFNDPNQFEDRLQTARDFARKRTWRNRPFKQVPRTTTIGDAGQTVTVLDRAPTVEAKPVSAALVGLLKDLAKQLEGNAASADPNV